MLTTEHLIANQDLMVVRLLQTIASLQRRPRTSHIDKTISDCRRTIAEFEKSKAMMSASEKPSVGMVLDSTPAK